MSYLYVFFLILLTEIAPWYVFSMCLILHLNFHITTHTTTFYESYLTNETTPSHEGAVFIHITVNDKNRMYDKWEHALIVKF